jgi:hypothetical protein
LTAAVSKPTGFWNKLNGKEDSMSFVKSGLLLVLFVFFPVFLLPAQVTKTSLQAMYMDYLRGEGYVPSIDDDGDVRFRYEGGTYYIIVQEGDLEYFRILYPNFWEIESEEELLKAHSVISYVNRTTKVAKIFLNRDEDDVSIAGETLLDAPEDFRNFIKRVLNAIGTARADFRNRMNSD